MNKKYFQVEYKQSGDKRTIKVTPPSLLDALFSIRGKPDPGKGDRNPPHWQERVPKRWKREREE